ncbi:hypothetical protein A2U01_0067754, partial [Trifolium medium]|nr:hypothetical protein [Trifolium medium]
MVVTQDTTICLAPFAFKLLQPFLGASHLTLM